MGLRTTTVVGDVDIPECDADGRPHDTPASLARALARWAPRRIQALLEPSVGAGALLAPLADRLRREESMIVCVDTSISALRQVERTYRRQFGTRLTVKRADFLQLDLRAVYDSWSLDTPGFDCVVMNPPFFSRGAKTHAARLGALFAGIGCELPLEAVFLAQAVEALRPGGRVLAVLPSSVIAGETCRPLRERLLKLGQIIAVHELPQFTFPNIEARVYLFCFERGPAGSAVTLLNHRLERPDRLRVPTIALGVGHRLDFGYQAAATRLDRIVAARDDLEWTVLGELADVRRGVHAATRRTHGVLHTNHFRCGFWRRPSGPMVGAREDVGGVKSTDILMARVHRECLGTIGMPTRAVNGAWSDCLLRIRPRMASAMDTAGRRGALNAKPGERAARLLFALDILFALDEVADRLLLRGIGAQYVGQAALEGVPLPALAWSRFPKLFERYAAALRERARDTMSQQAWRVAAILRR